MDKDAEDTKPKDEAITPIVLVNGVPKVERRRKALTEDQFDEAIEMIISGCTHNQITKYFGIARSYLSKELYRTEARTLRVREAREEAGEAFADKVEEVLTRTHETMVDAAVSRELASYYKWRAKVANPKRFGEKVEFAGKLDLDIKQITGMKVE